MTGRRPRRGLGAGSGEPGVEADGWRAGMVKAGLNVTTMVLGEGGAPPDEVVNRTVHVETV